MSKLSRNTTITAQTKYYGRYARCIVELAADKSTRLGISATQFQVICRQHVMPCVVRMTGFILINDGAYPIVKSDDEYLELLDPSAGESVFYQNLLKTRYAEVKGASFRETEEFCEVNPDDFHRFSEIVTMALGSGVPAKLKTLSNDIESLYRSADAYHQFQALP